MALNSLYCADVPLSNYSFIHSLTHCLSVLSGHLSIHFSRWTWISQYQNDSILDFVGSKGDGGGCNNWSRMQISSQTITTNKPTLLFTGQMPFLLPRQRCRSTEAEQLKLILIKSFIKAVL